MLKKSILLLLIYCTILYACKIPEHKSILMVFPKIGIGETIYLSRVPFKGKTVLLDSIVIKNNHDPVTFSYANNQEEVYKITSTFNKFKVTFISDNSKIIIHANYFAKTAVIENSKATNSLLIFRKRQTDLAKTKDTLFFKNAINYADTVKSPAAFVMVYDDVDFGKDYKRLKRFIARAINRFPAYEAIREIEHKVNTYVKIMTEEYNIGEHLPFITLPDQNGLPITTESMQGKMYFIDFWSTWCTNCVRFTTVKKHIYTNFSKEKLNLVSIALEPEKEGWKRYIESEGLKWPQLIDQNMWEGTAVKTLKFDSIPFNFLVSEKGIILAKGIPADSLEQVIQNFIKHTKS